MKRYDLIVVGAGPSGLSAAIEAAKRGLSVLVFDENNRPGGQLFKQIHKFFGSKEHKAKTRGFRIGEELLQEAMNSGVQVKLNATVTGIFMNKEIVVREDEAMYHYKANALIVATGASENSVPFEGWTLPGVIGAGAAQTLMNMQGIQPGKRVLMLGSGNVGLVVSFQLLQAGCEIVAIADVSPRIGGYGVHAAKLARTGVPFYLSHTIVKVEGETSVQGVTIGQVDEHYQLIKGTEKHFDIDTICIAVGLSPMSELLSMAGCAMIDDPKKGGKVPVINAYGETSVSGIYAAGDVSGIEEASSAMIEGRMTGIKIAESLGFEEKMQTEQAFNQCQTNLRALREGLFAPQNKGKDIKKTDEGFPLSQSLLRNGFIAEEEIETFPGVTRTKGMHPVIECTQNIPCNPCQDACTHHCIAIGNNITALPSVVDNQTCIGCGLCVAACPGQAIFLVDESYEKGCATITLPYEFFPIPQKGDKGKGLDRSGKIVCDAEIVAVRSAKTFDKTILLTMKVPSDMAMKARFFKNNV